LAIADTLESATEKNGIAYIAALLAIGHAHHLHARLLAHYQIGKDPVPFDCRQFAAYGHGDAAIEFHRVVDPVFHRLAGRRDIRIGFAEPIRAVRSRPVLRMGDRAHCQTGAKRYRELSDNRRRTREPSGTQRAYSLRPWDRYYRRSDTTPASVTIASIGMSCACG